MLFLESLFFGLKSLIYALPVSFVVIFLISRSIANIMEFSDFLIPWNSIIISVVGVFALVLSTMMYSASKIKKENILEAIRQENI
ncbi:MAG: FtsX-like permease family protein [Clostridia bacterium]|nr:FtsX-like permease family protein [Clostridia bacterium]